MATTQDVCSVESLFNEDLRERIRYAREPNSPTIVDQWLCYERCCLEACHNSACGLCASSVQIDLYESQFQLLLEVVADELLPSHWRELCLNSLHRPLSQLRRLLRNTDNKTRLNELFYELASTARYVEKSFYFHR